jgi:hypothetical protein
MGNKKVIGLAVAALIVFVILSNPTGAADAGKTLLDWLETGAKAVITFLHNLFT